MAEGWRKWTVEVVRGHQGSASGSSGSSSWTLRWVGPRRRVATSAAASSSSVDASTPRSKQGAKTPKIPSWRVVWLAPLPRIAAGRSAARTTRRRPEWDASITAGSRFPTAVPEVVTTATGVRDPAASPSARNPADRSSTRTWSRTSPAASAAYSANARPAEREPGARTTSRTPPETSAASRCAARSEDLTAPSRRRVCLPPTLPDRTSATLRRVDSVVRVTSATSTSVTSDPDWWRQAVVYQIYPRSFADANGDGIGDLPRHHRPRVPYLVRLGVDAVWLSPFYPSALADGGYDVDDYRDVDPRARHPRRLRRAGRGAARAPGIKLIVDIVPNHTSNRHAWFRRGARVAARVRRPGPLHLPRRRRARRRGAADRLALVLRRPRLGADRRRRSGTCTSSPPSSPTSTGRPARSATDFLTTLRFWSDRGVDGFRIDVAHALVKDASVIAARRRRPAHAGADPGRVPGRRAPARGTATRSTRSTATGAPCSTSTTRPGWPSPRPGSPPTGGPRSREPEGLGQAFNFDLLLSAVGRGGVHQGHRPRTSRWRPRPARRRRGCSRTTTWSATPRATPAERRRPRRLAARAAARPGAGPRARPAPGPGRDAADARAAGLGLRLPGRGAGPAQR